MRPTLLLFAALPLVAADPGALSQVHSVYLLPMASGLDQYLANQLNRHSVFRVVTDPQKAEAVFTDRLGAPLEERLKELYPPPEPPKEEAEETKDDKQTAAKDARAQTEQPARVGSSWRSGRGNLFLVEGRTGNVLWSVFERPKSSEPRELDKTAERIVRRLKRDLEGK